MSPSDSRASFHLGGAPELITVSQAAELLRVPPPTVMAWIQSDAVPYVELPSHTRVQYRIPLQGLLSSLSRIASHVPDVPAHGISREAFREAIRDE